MGQVWTRDDWNNLIDQVNATLAGIITPLAHAPTQHIWTKQDIQAVRNASRLGAPMRRRFLLR